MSSDGPDRFAREHCTAADIRARLDELRAQPLIQDEKYRDQPCAYGGTWTSRDGRLRLWLGMAKPFRFRSGELALENLILLTGGLMIGIGCWLGICVSRRLERAQPSPPTDSLTGSRPTGGLISHLTLERINFADESGQAVEGLSEADLERIANLITPAMSELLRRSVAEEQKQQARRSGSAVPVVGKLHWRWRKPVPELVKFHGLCAAFVRDASVTRLMSRPLARYGEASIGGAGCLYHNWDDPDVTVEYPGADRDSPHNCVLNVSIGGLRIPVAIHPLGSTSRYENDTLAIADASVFELQTSLLVHPHSLLLIPEKVETKLEMNIADKAVEHAGNAWLIARGGVSAVRPGLRGAREGQVRCSDVMVV